MSFAGVYPAGQIQLGATILADGETFGDPAQVQAILARRRATLKALSIVIKHFPTGAPGEMTSQQPQTGAPAISRKAARIVKAARNCAS